MNKCISQNVEVYFFKANTLSTTFFPLSHNILTYIYINKQPLRATLAYNLKYKQQTQRVSHSHCVGLMPSHPFPSVGYPSYITLRPLIRTAYLHLYSFPLLAYIRKPELSTIRCNSNIHRKYEHSALWRTVSAFPLSEHLPYMTAQLSPEVSSLSPPFSFGLIHFDVMCVGVICKLFFFRGGLFLLTLLDNFIICTHSKQ